MTGREALGPAAGAFEAALEAATAKAVGIADDPAVYRALARTLSGPVLELGSGYGRILSALLHDGVDAHGIELDPERVSVGRQLLRNGGVVAAEARLLHGDARQPDGPPMGVVIAPYNFFALFDDEDVAAVLAATRARLAPGGAIITDTFLFQGPPFALDHGWAAAPLPCTVSDQAGTFLQAGRWCRRRGIHHYFRGWVHDGAMTWARWYRLRQRDLDTLAACLTRSGFVVERVVDERGAPPGESSHRAFLMARCRDDARTAQSPA